MDKQAKIVTMKNGGKVSKRLLAKVTYKDMNELIIDSENSSFEKVKKDSGGSKEWYFGNLTEKETDRLLISGDATDSVMEYVEQYKEELELEGLYDLQTSNKSCKRRRVFSDDGAEIDIDRALGGDCEYWETIKRDGKKEYITLAVQIGFSHGNKTKQFAQQTAIAFCTAEILEGLGYGVEIICTDSVYDGLRLLHTRRNFSDDLTYDDIKGISEYNSEIAITFTLKDCEETTDIRALASTSLPALLRKYSFMVQQLYYGHVGGFARKTSEEMLDFLDINFMIATQWNSGSQVTYIEKIIKEVTA